MATVEGRPVANNLWRVSYIHIEKKADDSEDYDSEDHYYMEHHNYVRICEIDDEIQDNYICSFHRRDKLCPTWVRDTSIEEINTHGKVVSICRGDLIIYPGGDMFIITKITPM